MRSIGLILVAALIAAPLAYFVPLTAKHDPGAIFSQYIGCAALIAMAIGQIMATRLSFVEPLFGGLDRVYVLHKWLGIGALAAVLLHDTIDAEIDGLGPETWLTDLAETLGEISLYGFLALILITIVTFIPYHLWKWSHKLMGTFFAMSAFHFAFISKPFANTDPVGMYVLSICILGVFAYLYTLLPAGIGSRSRPYTVESVDQTGGALAIQLRPDARGIKHRAGQFAFIGFQLPHLDEIHPFTISSAPNDDQSVRFTIKPLGDYTARLKSHLKPGTKAQISPAYGHFRLRGGSGSQIWIAGGIGVTPYLAWLEELTPEHGNVDFFFCIKGSSNAPHLSEIESAAERLPNLTLHLVDTTNTARLSAAHIIDSSGGELKKSHVYFCGPEPMREALQEGLVKAGLSRRRFHFEEFEIRSGIGLRKLFAFALKTSGLANKYPHILGRLA